MRERRVARALYLRGVAPSGGRTRTVYVPAGTADVVRRGAAVSAQVRTALEEISVINIELLSRGELA